MPVELFVVCLAVGAAAIALWVDVRFRRGARTVRAVAHLLFAVVVVHVLMPDAFRAVDAAGAVVSPPLAAVVVVLPSLTYLFLTTLWVLRLAQGLLPPR